MLWGMRRSLNLSVVVLLYAPLPSYAPHIDRHESHSLHGGTFLSPNLCLSLLRFPSDLPLAFCDTRYLVFPPWIAPSFSLTYSGFSV